MNHSIPATMKSPGEYRPGIWRGRVLQVKVTSYCDLDCKNCSVAVGIVKKLKRQFVMTPENFRKALQSLKGFPGVIGMFGGNPCLHPDFEKLCEIFREEVPDQDQRGLWSNNLFGHGDVCRRTFSPIHSNLNVHGSQKAWDEIRATWPEAKPIPAGLSEASHHGPIFGSMSELGVSDAEMWKRIGACYVNQTWSAEITMIGKYLLGYFCEVAATMAEVEGIPMYGTPITPGWWAKSMASPDFTDQVIAYCTRCLVPMNPRKVDAAGSGPEEFTAVWRPVLATIKGRPMKEVAKRDEIEGSEPATKYLPRGVMSSKSL